MVTWAHHDRAIYPGGSCWVMSLMCNVQQHLDFSNILLRTFSYIWCHTVTGQGMKLIALLNSDNHVVTNGAPVSLEIFISYCRFLPRTFVLLPPLVRLSGNKCGNVMIYHSNCNT